MIERVCFLVNTNLYESKRYFTKYFAEALERQNVQTFILDVNEGPLGADSVRKIKEFQPDLTASFNTLLPVSEEAFFWDVIKIPHLSLLLDPIIYSLDLIKSPLSILSAVDFIDAKDVHDQGFENIFLLPHAVEHELTYDPKQKRKYDVVLLGTCYDFEALQAIWREKNPPEVCEVIEQACENVLADNKTSIAQALAAAWDRSGLDPAKQDFLSHYYCVDYYTRGKDRLELVQSITDAEVHVFGDLCQDFPGLMDWSIYLSSQPNVTVHPSVTYAESLDILKQSKICLNSMPFFKFGTHERIFASLACGAVPLTTDNLFMQRYFVPEEELLLYQSKNKEGINARVNALLADEEKRAQMAAKGAEKVLQQHTWDVRATTLLKAVSPMLEKI